MRESTEEQRFAFSGTGFNSSVPVPVEVPVHVRGLIDGAKSLGADCPFEPFSEDTFTVLVSRRSAVLRLSANAAPGQTIVLTSPSLGRELPARVVRYRGHPDVKGYAEIEFTTPEPARAVEIPSPDCLPQNIPEAQPVAHSVYLQPSLYAEAAALPLVTPLADLLTDAREDEGSPQVAHLAPLLPKRTSIAAVSLAGALAHDAVAPPRPLHRRRKPETTEAAESKAIQSAPPAHIEIDLESLLAARRAAERARPSLAQLAARLLNPRERVLFSNPRRPRKRLITAATFALLLTLGAAGAWAVVRVVVPEPWPLPRIAAFAPPEPPMFVKSALVASPQLWFEPESLPLATTLVAPPAVMLKALAARRPAKPIVHPLAVSEAAPPNPAELGTTAAVQPAFDTLVSSRGVGASSPSSVLSPQTTGEGPNAPPRPPTGGVTPPRLVFQAPLQYPPFARQSGVQGDVVIDARINETGRVSDLRVISGPAALHQAAKDSLAQWRYQPATLGGKAIATYLYVTIQFRR